MRYAQHRVVLNIEQHKFTLRIAPSSLLATAAKMPTTKLSESFGTRCIRSGSSNSSRLAHLNNVERNVSAS